MENLGHLQNAINGRKMFISNSPNIDFKSTLLRVSEIKLSGEIFSRCLSRNFIYLLAIVHEGVFGKANVHGTFLALFSTLTFGR